MILIIIVLSIIIFSMSAYSSNITVCSAGCDEITLQTALDNAVDSDTIYINEEGVYSAVGDYVLTSDILSSIIVVNTSNVSLSGFNITGNTSGYGISSYGKNNITIRSVSVNNFSRGMNIVDTNNSFVYDNNLTLNDYGLVTKNSIGLSIYNNKLNNNNYGVAQTFQSNNGLIYDNIYNSNNHSLAIDSSNNIRILRENIIGSLNTGIRFDTCYNNTVENASILGSVTYDIYAGGSDSNNTIRNSIYSTLGAIDTDTYLIIQKIIKITVNDEDTNPAEDIDVYVSDKDDNDYGICEGYCTTDASGEIGILNLTVAIKNSASTTNLTPLHILATNVTHEAIYNLSDFSSGELILELIELDLKSPNITNILESHNNVSANISFNTSELANGSLRYSTSLAGINSGTVNTLSALALNHIVSITGLSPNTTYYYKINMTDVYENYNDTTIGNFTTNATLDLSAPVITFVSPSVNQSTYTSWNNIELSISTNEYSTCNVSSLVGSVSAIGATFTNVTSNNTRFYKTFAVDTDSTAYNNYFRVECIDNSSNYANKTYYFRILDTVGTVATFVSPTPESGSKNNKTSITVNVTIDEEQYTGYPKINFNNATDIAMTSNIGPSGNYYYTSIYSSLTEKKYSYIIILKDEKGNQVNYTRTYEVDVTKPTVKILYPENDMSLSACVPDPFNISIKEESTCEYVLMFDNEEATDLCIDNCDDDKSDCDDDAVDTADKTACKEDHDDCKTDCNEDRYKVKKESEMEETYDVEQCKEDCVEAEDPCVDSCDDTEESCLDDALNQDEKDNCNEERDDCETDCSDDVVKCEDKCEKDNLYVYTEEDTSCFGNGDFVIEFTCVDLAGNKDIKNQSFVVSDTGAPQVTEVTPTGIITSSSSKMSVTTDESSLCRFDESDIAFADMKNKMSGEGKAHTYDLRSLSNKVYNYYVRCEDALGNKMTTSKLATFTVNAKEIVVKPTTDQSVITITPTAKSTKTFTLLISGKESKFDVTSKDISVNEVSITPNKDMPEVIITVLRSDLKQGMQKPQSEKVYQYIEINKENITNNEITKVIIKFKVLKSWLETNGVKSDEIVMYHYDEISKQWQTLDTKRLSEDTENIYYSCESSGLSLFSIGYKKSGVVAPVTPTGNDVNTNTAVNNTGNPSTEDNPSGKGGLKSYLWIIIIVCSLVVVGGGVTGFVLLKKHPQQNKSMETTTSLSSLSQEKRNINKDNNQNLREEGSNLRKKEGAYQMEFEKIGYKTTKNDQVLSYIFSCVGNKIPIDNISSALASSGYTKQQIDYHFDRMGLIDGDLTKYIYSSVNSDASKTAVMNALLNAGYRKEQIQGKFIELGIENNELTAYIENMFKSEYEESQIANALVSSGYDPAYANLVVSSVVGKIRRGVVSSYVNNTADLNISVTSNTLYGAGNSKNISTNAGYQSNNMQSMQNNAVQSQSIGQNMQYGQGSFNNMNQGSVASMNQSSVSDINVQKSTGSAINTSSSFSSQNQYFEGFDQELFDYAKSSLREGVSKGHLMSLMVKAGHEKKDAKNHIDLAADKLNAEGFKKKKFLGIF